MPFGWSHYPDDPRRRCGSLSGTHRRADASYAQPSETITSSWTLQSFSGLVRCLSRTRPSPSSPPSYTSPRVPATTPGGCRAGRPSSRYYTRLCWTVRPSCTTCYSSASPRSSACAARDTLHSCCTATVCTLSCARRRAGTPAAAPRCPVHSSGGATSFTSPSTTSWWTRCCCCCAGSESSCCTPSITRSCRSSCGSALSLAAECRSWAWRR